MNRYIRKMLRRSIVSGLGRYLAILAIVALGVGFFAGLKSSMPAMLATAKTGSIRATARDASVFLRLIRIVIKIKMLIKLVLVSVHSPQACFCKNRVFAIVCTLPM